MGCRPTACVSRRPPGSAVWSGKAIGTRQGRKSPKQGGRLHALLGRLGVALLVASQSPKI